MRRNDVHSHTQYMKYRCAMGKTLAGSQVRSRPSARTSYVSESTSMRGVALLRIIDRLPILRVFETGRSFFASPNVSAFLSPAWLTKVNELSVKQRPNAPNIGR